jgi:hypothetical protein
MKLTLHKANLLTLNFDKTYFIEIFTKNRHPMDIHINYGVTGAGDKNSEDCERGEQSTEQWLL